MDMDYDELEAKLNNPRTVNMTSEEMCALFQHRILSCFDEWKWADVMVLCLMVKNGDVTLPTDIADLIRQKGASNGH